MRAQLRLTEQGPGNLLLLCGCRRSSPSTWLRNLPTFEGQRPGPYTYRSSSEAEPPAPSPLLQHARIPHFKVCAVKWLQVNKHLQEAACQHVTSGSKPTALWGYIFINLQGNVTIATAPARLALQGPAHGPAQVHLSVQDTLSRTLCLSRCSVFRDGLSRPAFHRGLSPGLTLTLQLPTASPGPLREQVEHVRENFPGLCMNGSFPNAGSFWKQMGDSCAFGGRKPWSLQEDAPPRTHTAPMPTTRRPADLCAHGSSSGK
ncbi:uncharacterized protein LOC111827680 [Myotis lucifugus]|uniref:uncharacterized protein LOC111827680 n=1 Tax=Myotis lucifugus TaxID=59463 RepID=UPI000CCC6E8A|nr:uncharacterized protein LOC111827680 [Myotis lucifugus]